MYSNVYKTLNKNGIYLVGLFISPPAPSRTPYSGMDAEGVVCDYHVSANLTALRGSRLIRQAQRDAVGRQGHVLSQLRSPSIVLPAGEIQTNQKTFADLMREISAYSQRCAGQSAPSSFRRRFRWRPIGVIAERLACTTNGRSAPLRHRHGQVPAGERAPAAHRQLGPERRSDRQGDAQALVEEPSACATASGRTRRLSQDVELIARSHRRVRAMRNRHCLILLPSALRAATIVPSRAAFDDRSIETGKLGGHDKS